MSFVRQRYGHDSSHIEAALHECCVSGKGEVDELAGRSGRATVPDNRMLESDED